LFSLDFIDSPGFEVPTSWVLRQYLGIRSLPLDASPSGPRAWSENEFVNSHCLGLALRRITFLTALLVLIFLKKININFFLSGMLIAFQTKGDR
jgi:hypothetical protein